MHEQEVGGVFFLTDFLRNTGGHRHSRYTGGTDEGIDFTFGSPAHNLAEQNAAGCTQTEGNQTESDNAECLGGKEQSTTGGSANGNAQKDRDDIHEFILCCFSDTVNHTAFLKEIAEHEHTDQRGGIRQKNGNQYDNDDRENDLFELRNGAKLSHDNGAFLFGGEQTHNRRLDNRHQSHIGISGYGDGAKQFRRQLRGNENSGRTVCTADNGNRTGFIGLEVEEDSADKGNENTDLCGGTQDKAFGIGNQGSEVGHSADAEEDQRRENAEMYTLIEVVEQTAVFGDGIIDSLIQRGIIHQNLLHRQRIKAGGCGLCLCEKLRGCRIRGRVKAFGGDLLEGQELCRGVGHDFGKDVDDHHTEGNRQKQKGFILLFDSQKHQQEGNDNHDIVFPAEVTESRRLIQSDNHIAELIEYIHRCSSFLLVTVFCSECSGILYDAGIAPGRTCLARAFDRFDTVRLFAVEGIDRSGDNGDDFTGYFICGSIRDGRSSCFDRRGCDGGRLLYFLAFSCLAVLGGFLRLLNDLAVDCDNED